MKALTPWKWLEVVLLALGVGIALWPIWANAFFLTNDGPCHLYNARILRDMLLGHDKAYYAEWLTLNPDIEPNWLNHFLLVLFQLVLPPIVAEKLFLTLYILGFAFAFRYLARSIFPTNASLVFLALPFLYHKVFLMGFFNFSASVVLFFLVVGYWLRHRADAGWRSRAKLGLLLLVLLLAHPVSYCMAMGLIALQWLGECVTILARRETRAQVRPHLRHAGATALAAAPSLGLLLAFLGRQGTHAEPSGHKLHKLWHDLLELKALVLFDATENPWPIILAVLIGLLVLIGLGRMRKRPLHYEGMLAMFGLSIYAYLTQPGQVGGVGIVPERLQFYPYLFALCWLATIPWPAWLMRVVMLTGFALTLTLGLIRLPHFAQTSEAVAEFVSVQPYMQPHTTVLMLDYAPEGRLPNDGPIMSKEAFLFMHIAEYLGALQPHIILNNYEANTKWFPLRWRADRDPYIHLAEGAGFEGWFPTVDFQKFRAATGHDVDYVITWCFSEGLKEFEGGQLMPDRLAQDYQEVFVSEGKRVRLWQHNQLRMNN